MNAQSWTSFIYKFRYLVMLATLIIVGLVAYGGSKLTLNTDYRVFFGEDNPDLQAFEAIQNTYTKYDNILLVLVPKEGDAFSQNTLDAVEWTTEQAWQLPFSTRVDSLSNFQFTHANDDELIVEDLFTDGKKLDEQQREQIKQIALNEPLLLTRLISNDAITTAVNITIQLPGVDASSEVPEVAAAARALAQEVRNKYPNLDVYITGIVMMNNAFAESAQMDMQTLVPIMFGVVIFVFLLLTRSITGMVGTVFMVFFSIAIGMGAAGWAGIYLTGPTMSAPTIILTLAVADCVHIMVTFLHGMHNGQEKFEAMKESIRINFEPIFLTSLTTAIGFLTLNFSDTPPFRDLGNIAAVGVMAAWLLSMTFFPAFVLSFPVRVKKRAEKSFNAMQHLANFVINNRKRIVWVSLPIVILLVGMIPRNELNDDFVKYFDNRVEFRTHTDKTTEHLSGIYTIQYSLSAGEEGGISSPEFLKTVENFAEWYKSQPYVEHVNTITDTFKRLNKNLHGDDDSWYKTPDNKQLAAQYLLLYEMSLPYGLDLNNQIDIDKSSIRVVITTENIPNNEFLELTNSGDQWLKDNAPDYMHTKGSSPSVMFAHISKRNIYAMLIGTTVALTLISLILMIALRSFKIGLISLIPNLLPVGIAFGVWAILVGQVGLASSVVAAICMGIVVDDTVHFLSKYLRARREKGLDATEAVRYAFSSVGIALWVTSLILVMGFMVLASSSFAINEQMGKLTSITIATALILDFIILPPLLIFLDKKK